MENAQEIKMRKLGSNLDLEELSRSTSLNDISNHDSAVARASSPLKFRRKLPICIFTTLCLSVINLAIAVIILATQGTDKVYSWVSSATKPTQCEFALQKETVTYAQQPAVQLRVRKKRRGA
jgi:hypothetical protein